MPFPFEGLTTVIYTKNLTGWQRDERRLYGGNAVLSELLHWKGEEQEFYDSRTNQASYITLPKLHASTLIGHLSGATPMPDFAELGSVRERSELDGNPSLAELLWYNVGIGNDGDELIPWIDGVNERALATGFRWVFMEMPTLEDLIAIREMNDRPVDAVFSYQDVIDGFRPYPVEYAPQDVPFWQYTNRRLDCACLKIPINPKNLVTPEWGDEKGWYLLVRKGFKGLGDEFAEGGWWKYDPIGELVGQGTWEKTKGQIPLFPFIGEPSPGTPELPTIGRSLTMELGQIAVSLMNRTSERNWNMMQAAKSVDWILGIDGAKHRLVINQLDLGSITVGVPPVMGDDGRVFIPQMYNSSASLLDASAFKIVIEGGLEEAREIMVKQVTSTPDSSGRSKEAGFAEATSPLLKRLAATRQQAINTLLYFYSLRAGIANPTASITMPREFQLAPVVDEIEAGLNLLKRSWLRSVTAEVNLVMRYLDEKGLLPDNEIDRAKVKRELEESAVVTEAKSPLEDDTTDTPGRQAPGQQAA